MVPASEETRGSPNPLPMIILGFYRYVAVYAAICAVYLVFCEATSSSMTIGVVSWNLAEKIPSDKDAAFLKEFKNDDIVVLGAQECEDVKFRRHEGHKSRAWHALQKKMLGKKYKNIATGSLGGIKLDVYVKSDLKKVVSLVKVIDVPCGIGNVIGNKGGVCAVLKAKDSYVAVINSHFAAHQNKIKERNQDYSRIVTTMSTRLSEEVDELSRRAMKKKKGQKKSTARQAAEGSGDERMEQHLESQRDLESRLEGDSQGIPRQPLIEAKVAARFDTRFDVEEATDSAFNSLFDAVIFLGDFNYRLNVPRLEIELAKEEKRRAMSQPTEEALAKAAYEMESVFEYDQLHRERSQGKVFALYKEERIDFVPTYKYDKHSDEYDSSPKMRSPAWTDRILYYAEDGSKEDVLSPFPSPEEGSDGSILGAETYKSVDSRASDHRPVMTRLILNKL